MKKTVRIISLLMVVCLLAGLLTVSAFATKKDTYGVTVLGDSISSGYGLPAYQKGLVYWGFRDGQEIPGSYGSILRGMLQMFFERSGKDTEVTLNMDGRIAWRTTEFLNMMSRVGVEISAPYDACESDPYFTETPELLKIIAGDIPLNTTEYFRYGITMGQLAPNDPSIISGLDDHVVSDIKNSELVVLNYGANDVFTYALSSLLCKWVFPLMDDVLTPGLGVEEILKIVSAKFLETYTNADEGQKHLIVADFLNAMEIGMDRLKNNMPLVLDAVREINPDALIAVVGIVNPLLPLELGPVNLQFLQYFDPYVTRANTTIRVACAAQENCEYVDVVGTSYWNVDYEFSVPTWETEGDHIFAQPLDDAFRFSLELIKAFHPDEQGHETMAQRIYDSVVSTLSAPTILSADRGLFKKPHVKWERVPGAYGYVVYRSLLPNGIYRPVKVVKGTGALDLSAVPGLNYYYKVSAILNATNTLHSVRSDWVHAERAGSLLSILKPSFSFSK